MIGLSELLLTFVLFILINKPQDFKNYYQKWLELKKYLKDLQNNLNNNLHNIHDDLHNDDVEEKIIIGDDGKKYKSYQKINKQISNDEISDTQNHHKK